MHINIINKLKHDKITFGLAALLAVVAGILGYIVLGIQGQALHFGL